MAKYVLDSKELEPNFVILGISSYENIYALVTGINRIIDSDLCLSDNLPFNLKAGNLFYFSLFHYLNEETRTDYYLISNTSNFEQRTESRAVSTDLFSETEVEESTRLIKELPKTDYFFIIKGDEPHLYQFKIIEKLKNLEAILQIQTIEPKDLPSRMNLVF